MRLFVERLCAFQRQVSVFNTLAKKLFQITKSFRNHEFYDCQRIFTNVSKKLRIFTDCAAHILLEGFENKFSPE